MLNKLVSIAGVDVWQGELHADGEQLSYFTTLLNEAERARAGRFATAALRDRYVETRGRMRSLLATYCGCPPQSLQFAEGTHGKPYLPDFPEIAFNLSHSHERLALAVAVGSGYQIGIDIEAWRERIGFPELVQRCFAASEREYWENLPEARRTEAFYALWTQKEAFVKAVGRGIAIGLEFCVLSTGGAPRMLALPEGCGGAADWRVEVLPVGERISGALVFGKCDAMRPF